MTVCVREGGPAKNPSPHLHDFEILFHSSWCLRSGVHFPKTTKSDSVLPTASHHCNVSSEQCCPDA